MEVHPERPNKYWFIDRTTDTRRNPVTGVSQLLCSWPPTFIDVDQFRRPKEAEARFKELVLLARDNRACSRANRASQSSPLNDEDDDHSDDGASIPARAPSQRQASSTPTPTPVAHELRPGHPYQRPKTLVPGPSLSRAPSHLPPRPRVTSHRPPNTPTFAIGGVSPISGLPARCSGLPPRPQRVRGMRGGSVEHRERSRRIQQ
ncbi:hypothetical protein A4X09_0g7654, partial [Tilletia walkeri]